MRLYIDLISGPEYAGTKFVQIEGWAFIEGHSTKDSKTYVILKSDAKTYVFDTIPKYTWWVPGHFEITNLDLDWAGFIARIPEEQHKSGTYQVGIYIKKSDIEALQYTDNDGRQQSLTIPFPH